MGMGTPIRVDVNGTPIMICCEGCRKGLLKEPEKNFQILKDYHEGNKKTSALGSENDSSSSDVPQMEIPQMEIPQMEIPQMELPKMELPK
jgi:hypothetical protein